MNHQKDFGKWQTEWQLWADVRAGDEQAFTHLFEAYHANLYNYGAKLTEDTSLLEDAIQEVFIDIWRLRANLAERVLSVRYYLLRCLRRKIHLATNRQSQAEVMAEFSDSEILLADFSHRENDWIAAETFQQKQQLISSLLSTLPRRQAEAITLRYFEGLSTVQIATLMGVSPKSVRNFLYKGLQSMRLVEMAPQFFLALTVNLLFC